MLIGLVFQAAQLLEHHGLPLAEKGYDDRQSHGNLGGRHGDDEKDKKVTIHDSIEPGEGGERQDGGVQHQLQRHEHDQRIPPEEDTEKPDRKQQARNQQERIQGWLKGHGWKG